MSPVPPGLPSIYDCVLAHARDCPDRAALVGADETVSYGALAPRVAALAGRLRAMGLGAGDVVGVVASPRVDAYVLHLAVIALGAVWLGINPRYTYAEMEFIARDARPAALFHVGAFDGRDYRGDVARLAEAVESVRHCVSLDEPGAVTAPRPGDDAADTAALPPRDPGAVAMIVYTSGSSGQPKGCMLRAGTMVHRAWQQTQGFDYDGEVPVLYNPWPMNHVGGLQLVCAYACFTGGTIVFQEKFSPAGIGPLVARNGVDMLILLPTMYHLMLSDPAFDAADFASVRLFMFAGGSLGPGQIRRLQGLGRGRVQANYGLSEGHSTVAVSRPGLDAETLSVTLGRSPFGETRARALDGRDCGEGEQGELQVRREHCMAGYLNRPEATRDAFTGDGWLRTGDMVEVMPGGEMRLVGRLSEMYKSGGFNIHPREIEMRLEAHPAVALAAVVARPHAVYGEVGCACLVPEGGAPPTPETLDRWCRETLAGYKVPKEFMIRKDLPLLANNKIDKRALKAELGL